MSCTASHLPRSVSSGVLRTPAVKFPWCSVIDRSMLHSAAEPCLFQTPASERGAHGVLYAQHLSSTSKTWIRRMGSAVPASGAAITGRCRRAPRPEWLDSSVPHGTRCRCVLRNARLYYLYKCAGIFQTSRSHSGMLPYVQYSSQYFSVERERTERRDAARRGRLYAWGVPSRSSSGGRWGCGRGGGAKRPL